MLFRNHSYTINPFLLLKWRMFAMWLIISYLWWRWNSFVFLCKRKCSSIYAILARFVLHNYTNRVHDYAFQDGMRADANFVRLRPSGLPLLNIRGTAPKRPPKFSCASSCPQVRTDGCSPTLLRMFRIGGAEASICCRFFSLPPLCCCVYLCRNMSAFWPSFPTKYDKNRW